MISCVYKLSYKDYYYIGSSVDLLQRMETHKNRFDGIKKGKYIGYSGSSKYKKLLELGLEDFDDIDIEIIYYSENKQEILKEEDKYIYLNDCKCLNKRTNGFSYNI